jgi:hypothetical protein
MIRPSLTFWFEAIFNLATRTRPILPKKAGGTRIALFVIFGVISVALKIGTSQTIKVTSQVFEILSIVCSIM